MEMLTNCDMTCAVEMEDALMSSSWLADVFPEGAVDFWVKGIAATGGKKRPTSLRTCTAFPVIVSRQYVT